MQQNRQSLKNGYHVLTVRMPLEDFKHLKLARQKLAKKDRRKWTYTEIIVNQIRQLDR